MIRFAPLLGLLLTASVASAQHVYCPQVVTRFVTQTPSTYVANQQAYVADQHHNAVIALFATPFYLGQNPVPSAAHAEAAPSACETRTAALEAKFDKLLAAIVESRQPPQVAPQPLPAGPPLAPPPLAAPRVENAPPPVKTAGVSPFLANCAACHDASVAASKGGGRAFFLDGKERPLTCDEAADIYEAVEDGTMPKGRKIDDQTIADINARVRDLRKAGKTAAAK
jgi:mono/diheme cytochrome c family protein